MQKKGLLSGNALKIIALVTMTIDHMGMLLFPSVLLFRVIGRLAMPIFAYMIAEGCKYTRNKVKHFLLVFLLGVVCQVVYYFANHDLMMSILIDFSMSILVIYAIEYAKSCKNWKGWLLPVLSVILVGLCVYVLPLFIKGLYFDYGFFGILAPVCVYMFDKKWLKLVALAIALLPVSACAFTPIQWFCYLALIPLALYNGKRGKYNIKYLFYLYYPLHLVVLYAISLLI